MVAVDKGGARSIAQNRLMRIGSLACKPCRLLRIIFDKAARDRSAVRSDHIDRIAAAKLALHARRPGGEQAVALRQRSEEHTSELQSLMRISYAVFCL